MDNDLAIETDWESSAAGSPEEAATFAALGIRFGNFCLTEAEDSFVNRIREKVYLSAYPLAQWLAWNWWRQRWEPRRHTHDWAMAHRMPNIGAGYVWPDITIFSDGERIVLDCAPTRRRASEPLRYICQTSAIVRAAVFEDAIDAFVRSVIDQLDAKQVVDTNLAQIWSNLTEERMSSELTMRRKLEALLGYDVDEADEGLIERLVRDMAKLGESGVQELAASHHGNAEIASSADIEAAAESFGFQCNPRDSVQLRSAVAGQLPVGVAAWDANNRSPARTRSSVSLLSSPIAKNIPVPFLFETLHNPSLSHPTRGAFRDRHRRGMRCDGRGGIGRDLNWQGRRPFS